MPMLSESTASGRGRIDSYPSNSVLTQLPPRVPHVVRLLELLPSQIQTNSMVEYQTRTGLGGHDQQWQQSHANDQVCLCRYLPLVPASCFLASSDPPAI